MMHVRTTLLALGFLFASAFCLAAENPELKDRKDRESYSLGYQFGQAVKAQGLELNLEVYSSAVQDALEGKKPRLREEEIHKTAVEIQKRVMAARQKELKEAAEKNLSRSRAFLEENRKKEGVTTLPSGLQYIILAEGSGKTPQAADRVKVNYRGILVDGTEFDSSYKRGSPAEFQVDKVIRGWTEALRLMKEGSKWRLFLPPELAYGERGAGPIPPNSALIFEVELISVP